MKKTNDLRGKSEKELLKLEKDLRQELFNLRFQLAINQIENPMRIRAVKREIARIKTILRQRELEAQVQEMA